MHSSGPRREECKIWVIWEARLRMPPRSTIAARWRDILRCPTEPNMPSCGVILRACAIWELLVGPIAMHVESTTPAKSWAIPHYPMVGRHTFFDGPSRRGCKTFRSAFRVPRGARAQLTIPQRSLGTPTSATEMRLHLFCCQIMNTLDLGTSVVR